MKTAVVFYSLDGSTRVAAQAIADKYGADVFELKEAKHRGRSTFAFMGSGFSALVGARSRLVSTYSKDMQLYDQIYIGTPVWASKPVPAVNTFVAELEPRGKEIIIFTVQADKNDSEPIKGSVQMKKKLEDNGAIVTQILTLVGAGVNKTADRKEMNKQIEEKTQLA